MSLTRHLSGNGIIEVAVEAKTTITQKAGLVISCITVPLQTSLSRANSATNLLNVTANCKSIAEANASQIYYLQSSETHTVVREECLIQRSASCWYHQSPKALARVVLGYGSQGAKAFARPAVRGIAIVEIKTHHLYNAILTQVMRVWQGWVAGGREWQEVIDAWEGDSEWCMSRRRVGAVTQRSFDKPQDAPLDRTHRDEED